MKDIELYRLCQRFIEGDEKAFNEIYEDTKGKIFANIYSYVKSKEASEDILSDTYIRFINCIKDLTPDKSILGYLYTISRNLSLNYIEKNKRFVDDSTMLIDNASNEENSYLDNSDIIKIMKEILSPDMFNVIMLHLINGLEYKEIAETLNKNENTIRWQYNEGLKKVREALKDDKIRKWNQRGFWERPY